MRLRVDPRTDSLGWQSLASRLQALSLEPTTEHSEPSRSQPGHTSGKASVKALIASAWGMRKREYWLVDDQGVITSEEFAQDKNRTGFPCCSPAIVLLAGCASILAVQLLFELSLDLHVCVDRDDQDLPCTLMVIFRELFYALELHKRLWPSVETFDQGGTDVAL
ncbi:Hypothetical Protein FCC1311_090242 [Hondaea fermentalgiana]|uniref:Uncharacterized protein n=1 Tax=Hondaea fermentalgiana TaxID=2315210 RepID=A0A2R5GR60_9STRA|nr:Hypothetical Protein FCC1311_090242 [Hondaea fermentalgiana]|eukprot:GBG32799.1 Hypothetical Protein FCC1311_090242 [Hondaea fermentalgiana]